MAHLKKYFAFAIIALSVFLMVGCGQDSSDADKANQELIKQQKQQEAEEAVKATSTTQIAWQNLEASEVEKLVNSDKTVQIIDVRDMYAFSNKRIPRADLLPLSQIQEKYTMIDKTNPVLFYDDDGQKSAAAAKFLTDHGYTKVMILRGGMARWNGPVEP